MPHSYSGKQRTKRPDYRPSAKQRKKDLAARVEAADVSELRKTKKKKSEYAERQVTGVLRKAKKLTAEDKRVKFLRKLLKQIEALIEKRESGVELDEAQTQKAARYDEIIGEIEELLDVNLSDSDEEDEEEEDEDSDAADAESVEEEQQSVEEEQPSPPPSKKRKASSGKTKK